jgi:hypothetical protein
LPEIGRPNSLKVLRTMAKLQRDAASKDEARQRKVVHFVQALGIALEPGDQLVVFRATWRVLPPGERKGYRKKRLATYEVTADDSLRRRRSRALGPRTA